jgi:hypothetical protein
MNSHQKASRKYYLKNREKMSKRASDWYKANKKAVISKHKMMYDKKKGTFKCDLCKKKFATKATLSNHKKTLSHLRRCPDWDGVKPQKMHKCDLCDLSYSTKYVLARHYKTKKHLDKKNED